MGLLGLLFAISIIQLHGVSTLSEMPKLKDNKLSEGAERDLPNATPISCGCAPKIMAGYVTKTLPLEDALKRTNFETYQFTAGAISSVYSPRVTVSESRFSFAEIKGNWKSQYALQLDESGERGYWLPQGGTIDILAHPPDGSPRYVFTPDFSGCSLTATPLDDKYIRLRHVEGGAEGPQFNHMSEAEKGGPTTYAMEYKEYGFLVQVDKLLSNVPAFAYMRYLPINRGTWILSFQRKSCAATLGGFTFKNQKLTDCTIIESFPNPFGKQIANTKDLNIIHKSHDSSGSAASLLYTYF